MKNIRHRLEYLLVVLLDIFFHLLPRQVAFKVGEGVGFVMSQIMESRQRLIVNNLSLSFPKKTPEEIEKIAAGVWRNLGRIAVEFVYLPTLLKSVTDTAIWEGDAAFEKAVKAKNGVILLAAHFTNWEILGALVAQRFQKFEAIARPMHNPYVQAWVQSKRGGAGTNIILHRQAVRASLKWLKKGNIIGILVDQNLYTGGEFVNFFGRPAATTNLPTLLNARTEAPVFIISCLREGDTFRIRFQPVLKPDTQTIAHAFEKIIQEKPENWFWIHNRWKRKI